MIDGEPWCSCETSAGTACPGRDTARSYRYGSARRCTIRAWALPNTLTKRVRATDEKNTRTILTFRMVRGYEAAPRRVRTGCCRLRVHVGGDQKSAATGPSDPHMRQPSSLAGPCRSVRSDDAALVLRPHAQRRRLHRLDRAGFRDFRNRSGWPSQAILGHTVELARAPSIFA